jgi:Integrase core domain
VVDRFSKMVHLCVLPVDTTAPVVADTFFSNIVRLHGLPKSIVSDRDPRFNSRFWRELLNQVKTELHMSTAWHPESDG